MISLCFVRRLRKTYRLIGDKLGINTQNIRFAYTLLFACSRLQFNHGKQNLPSLAYSILKFREDEPKSLHHYIRINS